MFGRFSFRIFAVLLVIGMAGASADAGQLVFTIDNNSEFSGSGAVASGDVIVTIDDTVANTVQVTVDATNLTVSSEFISDLWLNLDPTPTGSYTPTGISGPQPDVFDVNTVGGSGGGSAFKPDGDGYFDFHFGWPTGNSDPNRFDAGETSVFTISGSGISAAAFNDISVDGNDPSKNGFHVAAHIQGIPNGNGSGFFSEDGEGPGPTPVPEPASAVLAFLGLGGLGLIGFRRRKRFAA